MKTTHSPKDYTPMDPDYFDTVQLLIGLHCKVHYFDTGNKVMDATGVVTGLFSPDGFSRYVVLDNEMAIRADRIITLNGRPGPAFDEYDLYALQCLTCMGGM